MLQENCITFNSYYSLIIYMTHNYSTLRNVEELLDSSHVLQYNIAIEIIVFPILLSFSTSARNFSIDLYLYTTSWFIHASKAFAKIGTKRPGVDAENCRRHLKTKRNYWRNRAPLVYTYAGTKICDSHFYPALMGRRQSRPLFAIFAIFRFIDPEANPIS